MAINAMLKRHCAAPTNPIDGFSLVALPHLTQCVKMYHESACAFASNSWEIGRGLAKLSKIDESIALDQREDGVVSLMLKKEVNAVSLTNPQLPSKARGIQFNVNLRTAYEFGNEQYNFCHALAEASEKPFVIGNTEFHLRYTASMTPEDLGQFAVESERERANWVDSFLDERDGKNWDANVQTAHRQALVEWYREISQTLYDVASKNIQVKGKYRNKSFKLVYEIDGTVKSGHFDTSSGNGALNIEVTAQAIAGLPKELRPRLVRGLIMGDDLLLWLYFDIVVDPQAYLNAINQLEAKLGINPVRGLFRDVLNVSFCSLGFYHTNTGIVAVPKLGRVFAKLFWTVTPLMGRDPARLASTIAHSFYPTYHQYRPMREFLKRHMDVAPLEVDQRTWAPSTIPYVCREFGLPRGDGVHWASGNEVKYGLCAGTLEDIGEVLEMGPGIVQHDVVDIMLREDMSDPPDRRGVIAY